jgi:hypothetical protein
MKRFSVALVSCVKSKKPVPAAARDLYTSPLFRGMATFAQSHASQWFILSAKHGLLNPSEVIEPYEMTLRSQDPASRRSWAERVCGDLLHFVAPPGTILMLAGDVYRRPLAPLMRDVGFVIETPMEGLTMGKQLQWLRSKNAEV